MGDWHTLNLIRLFGFYLAAVFLISTYRRLQQYAAVYEIVEGARKNRWPNLYRMIEGHKGVFLTWGTLRPALLALFVTVVYTIASRVVWPHARLTPGDLWLARWAWLPVIGFGAGMLVVDTLGLLRVARIDRPAIEAKLKEAEDWLTSWQTPLIRRVTFGLVNPKSIVESQVQNALAMGVELVNRSLWWMSMQVSLRTAFGLTLWATWAAGRANAPLDATPGAAALGMAFPVWYG